MHKTNQTKNFKRQPGDLHRWRPASLFSFAVLIILVYQCRRLISGCLLLRLPLIILVLLLLLLLYIIIVLLLILLIIIIILRLRVLLLIIIIILLLFLLLLFIFLLNYSDESMRKLRA